MLSYIIMSVFGSEVLINDMLGFSVLVADFINFAMRYDIMQ